jgi:hypothetical protein
MIYNESYLFWDLFLIYFVLHDIKRTLLVLELVLYLFYSTISTTNPICSGTYFLFILFYNIYNKPYLFWDIFFIYFVLHDIKRTLFVLGLFFIYFILQYLQRTLFVLGLIFYLFYSTISTTNPICSGTYLFYSTISTTNPVCSGTCFLLILFHELRSLATH